MGLLLSIIIILLFIFLFAAVFNDSDTFYAIDERIAWRIRKKGLIDIKDIHRLLTYKLNRVKTEEERNLIIELIKEVNKLEDDK